MTAPRALPEITLDDDELVAAALAIGAGVLFANAVLFIAGVTVVTRIVRWVRR